MSLITSLITSITGSVIRSVSDNDDDKDIEAQAKAREAADAIKDKGEEVESELERKQTAELNSRREKAAKELKTSFDMSKGIDSELQSSSTESNDSDVLNEINKKLTVMESFISNSTVTNKSTEDESDGYGEGSEEDKDLKRPSIFKKYYLENGTVARGANRRRLRQDDLNRYKSEKSNNKVKDLYKKKEELENKRWYATLGLLGAINESQVYRTEKAIIKQKYEGEARNAEIKKLKEARKERRQAKLKKLGLMAALGLTPVLLSKNVRELLKEFSETNPIGKFFSGIFNAIKAPIESAWKWFTENTAIGQKVSGFIRTVKEYIGFDPNETFWTNLTNKIDNFVKTVAAPGAAKFLLDRRYITEEQANKLRQTDDIFELIGAIVSSVVSDTLFNWLGLDKLDKELLGTESITTLGGLLSAIFNVFRSRLEGFDSIKDWIDNGGSPKGKLGEAFVGLMKSLWDNVLEPVVRPLFLPIMDQLYSLLDKFNLFDLGKLDKTAKEYATKYSVSELEDIRNGKVVGGVKPTMKDSYIAMKILNNPEEYKTKSSIEGVSESVNITGVAPTQRLKDSIINNLGSGWFGKWTTNDSEHAGRVKAKLFGGSDKPLTKDEVIELINNIQDPIMLALAGLSLVKSSAWGHLKNDFATSLLGTNYGSDLANSVRDILVSLIPDLLSDSFDHGAYETHLRNILEKGLLGLGGKLDTRAIYGDVTERSVVDLIESYLKSRVSSVKGTSIGSIEGGLGTQVTTEVQTISPETNMPATEISEVPVVNEDTNLFNLSKSLEDIEVKLGESLKLMTEGSSTKIINVRGTDNYIPIEITKKDPVFSSNSGDILNQ